MNNYVTHSARRLLQNGLALVLLLGAGCTVPAPSLTQQKKDADLRFNKSDIVRLEGAAARGSEEAAFKLAMHYQQIVKDEAQRLYWLEKAAGLGSAAAMEYLVTRYTSEGEHKNREKAEYYWELLKKKYSEMNDENNERLQEFRENLDAMGKK